MGVGCPSTLGSGALKEAGITSHRDTAHLEEERKENARVRDFTLQAFRRMGYQASDGQTNCIFVNPGRPAKELLGRATNL